MPSIAPGADPRTTGEANVLPVVVRPRAGPPIWVLFLVAALAGMLLFSILYARQRALTAPAIRPRSSDLVTTPAPPPALYVPPAPAPAPLFAPAVPLAVTQPAPVYRPPPAPAPQVIYVPQPIPDAAPAPAPPRRVTPEPALVIDTTGAGQTAGGSPSDAAAQPPAPASNGIAGARVGAGVLANRATTVPQGTLIPAVLETALDSTRPGLARAIVSRDVRGFDGSRILIPRGSRLIGEYRSDAEAGQNRMLVTWIRLIRPDGATIAIGSPAGDTLGRGGIRASVNSHFFERFTGAILQSALDVGVNLASRSIDSPVVVLPGVLPGTTAAPVTNQVRPTLKVKAATSISIFVARDLDFGGVETR